MLAQLVPKLSAWEEKEKNFAIWGYGRMGVWRVGVLQSW